MYILSIQLFRLQVLIKSAFSSSDKSSSLTNRLEKPTIALSGVRISWLILARNDCLSSASIARSLAFINSSSLSLKCCILVIRPMMEADSDIVSVGLA